MNLKLRKNWQLPPGPLLSFKLDYEQAQTWRKRKPRLSYLLDDTAKLWSKRCKSATCYVTGPTVCADPSVRYYHIDELRGRLKVDLQTTSVREI